MPTQQLTTMTQSELLEAAILGYEKQRSDIAAKIVACQQILAPPAAAEREEQSDARKQHAHRHFSKASRRKMAASQRLRWARVKQKRQNWAGRKLRA